MVEGQAPLRIGELASRSGVARSRIRFYETAGLLAPTERTPAGYRLYGEDAVQALRIITHAQLGGFTLAEIKSLLPEPAVGGWDRDELLKALYRKAAALDDLLEQVTRSRQQVVRVIADIEKKPDDLDCTDNVDRIITGLQD
jgi:DNA-binding transcriptional MerR regulator